MASNNAFTLSGAQPQTGLNFSAIPNGTGSTPYSMALNGTMNTSTPRTANPLPPIHTPAPTTQPITEHTTTDAQGNTTKIKYAPTSGLINNSSSSGSNSGSNSQSTQPTSTFAGLLNTAMNNANSGAESITKASQLTPEQIAQYNALANLENAKADTTNRIYANGNMSLDSQQGAAGQVTRNTGLQEQSIQQALGLANQSQTQALTGATSAAGLQTNTPLSAATAAAPIQVPYTNQVIDPTTGQPIQGGGASGNGNALNPLNNIQTYAQQIADGKMSLAQANSLLGGSAALGGALNAAIRQLKPDFNFVQSDTLSSQQGTVGPALQFAQTALNNLKNVIGQLGPLQNTNIPGVNAATQGFSNITGIGSEAVRQYHGAVAEARNAYAQLLASSRGGTPTDYGDQAKAAIPDSPTPNDIDAALANLQTLGQSKFDIYSNPGSATTNNQSSTSSGWF